VWEFDGIWRQSFVVNQGRDKTWQDLAGLGRTWQDLGNALNIYSPAPPRSATLSQCLARLLHNSKNHAKIL
jgi:hypothetical protein